MKKQVKNNLGYLLVIIGFILIVIKAIDYFVPGKSLIPWLTLIGLVLVAIRLFMRKKWKTKKEKNQI